VNLAYNAMISGWKGEDLVPFAAFYDMFCKDVKERAKQAKSPLVVSHSVYRREVRDLIRERLPGVKFVVLDVPLPIAGERKVQNLVDTCEKRGITMCDFLRSFHPSMKDAPDVPFEQVKAMMIDQNTKSSDGFEPAGEDDIGIAVTAEMSKDHVVEKVLSAIASSTPSS